MSNINLSNVSHSSPNLTTSPHSSVSKEMEVKTAQLFLEKQSQENTETPTTGQNIQQQTNHSFRFLPPQEFITSVILHPPSDNDNSSSTIRQNPKSSDLESILHNLEIWKDKFHIASREIRVLKKEVQTLKSQLKLKTKMLQITKQNLNSLEKRIQQVLQQIDP